jgi:hypothetical protein
MKTNMMCLHNKSCGEESRLIVCDLRAQLAPLNRYGLPGLGAVVADGARALVGVSRSAVSAVVTRNPVAAANASHQLP